MGHVGGQWAQKITLSGKVPLSVGRRVAPGLQSAADYVCSEAASGIEPLYRVLQTPDEEEQDPS